jgi:hypothetical protein
MKKIRLFALAGTLGLTALTGAEATGIEPIEPFEYCLCACPDGSAVCVGSVNGDCAAPCAQAVQNLCPSDS